MNEQEIKHKLEQARNDRAITIDTLNDEISDLEDQLAEAEKPKLRHGVCAVANDGHPFVVIEQASLAGSPKAFYGDQSGQVEADKRIKNPTILIPNIFADLAALSEPLEEFEIGVVNVELDGRNLVIRDLNSVVDIPRKDIHDFILNLRRMELEMQK